RRSPPFAAGEPEPPPVAHRGIPVAGRRPSLRESPASRSPSRAGGEPPQVAALRHGRAGAAEPPPVARLPLLLCCRSPCRCPDVQVRGDAMLNSPLRPADLVCCSCCLNRCVPAVRRWRDRGGRGYAWLTEIPGQDQFPPMKGIHRLRPPSRGLDVGTLQLLPQCYFSKSDLCNS
uniref:Uncharacterized protein n=4 Tax=Aegilops tauschii subsp. strangulata TaxID=200361 RepID=A0A453K1F8_AEGTS